MLLAATALACGSGTEPAPVSPTVAGQRYALQSVDGQPLPYRTNVTTGGSWFTVLADTVAFARDGTFRRVLVSGLRPKIPDLTDSRQDFFGAYRDVSGAVTMTYAEPDPIPAAASGTLANGDLAVTFGSIAPRYLYRQVR